MAVLRVWVSDLATLDRWAIMPKKLADHTWWVTRPAAAQGGAGAASGKCSDPVCQMYLASERAEGAER